MLTLPAGLRQVTGAVVSLRSLHGFFVGLRSKAAYGASPRHRFGALWKVTIRFSAAEPLAQQMGRAGEIFLLGKQLAKINYSKDEICRTLAL